MDMSLLAALPWLLDPANWLVILAVAAGLGFVIFVHELGHFLVAKACGVKCEKFYIGFDIYGLKICKFQWGETEYGIGILPLGGYVKMLGQDDNPARIAEENRRAQARATQASAASAAGSTLATAEHAPPLTHGDLPPEPVSDPHTPYDPRSYMAQSVPKRMAIISAGVIMNVIFAFIMATLAYAIGVPEAPCVVGGTISGAPAWEAGLEPGDEVVRIATLKNPRFRDLQTGVTLGDLEEGIPFEIRRADGEKAPTKEIILHPDKSFGIPLIGITGYPKTELISPEKGKPTVKYSPARRATPEFEPGDRIVRINDIPVTSYRDISRALAKYVDQPIQVTVERVESDETTDEKKSEKKSAAKPVEVAITVEPAPVRDVGLVMTLGDVTSVRAGSPAAAAGIEKGDKLVSIDGQPIGNPLTLEARLRRLAGEGKSVQIEVERKAGETSEKKSIEITPLVPEFAEHMAQHTGISLASIGVVADVLPIVAAIEPDSPAAKADIKPGDKIVSERLVATANKVQDDDPDIVTTKEMTFGKRFSWPYFVYEVIPAVDPASKFELTIERDGAKHKVELPLVELKDDQGKVVHTDERGLLFKPVLQIHVAQDFRDAVRLGLAETRDSLLLVYRFLQKIGQGQISPKMTSGPVGIVQVAAMKVREGFPSFLIFLTMLSANLAVINFLPIPVLDGGHMVFLTYELIRGKPASERVIIAFTYAGLLMILSLMLFVLMLDIGLIPRFSE